MSTTTLSSTHSLATAFARPTLSSWAISQSCAPLRHLTPMYVLLANARLTRQLLPLNFTFRRISRVIATSQETAHIAASRLDLRRLNMLPRPSLLRLAHRVHRLHVPVLNSGASGGEIAAACPASIPPFLLFHIYLSFIYIYFPLAMHTYLLCLCSSDIS